MTLTGGAPVGGPWPTAPRIDRDSGTTIGPGPSKLRAQLVSAASVKLWELGWTVAADAGLERVGADLVCRPAKARRGSETRVALVVRPGGLSADDANATATAIAPTGARCVWFVADPAVVPRSQRPEPVFRIAATPAAGALAFLPESALALSFADAVEALFGGRIQFRAAALLTGPWRVAIEPVRLRCWRCGDPFAAVTPRAVRSDNHGRFVTAGDKMTAMLAARVLETRQLADSRGQAIAAARFVGPGPAWSNGCPTCDARVGPGTLRELRAEGAALETVYATVAAPDETTAHTHWCADAWTATGRWCPKEVATDSGNWLTDAATGEDASPDAIIRLRLREPG